MATAYTQRLKIPYPDENSTPDVPRDMAAMAVSLDHLVPIDVGPLTSEPPSSPGVPGVGGRMLIVTDQALTGPRLDVDTGNGWFTAGPAPVDAASNVPSSRTLGQGAQQACAGNDPRLVGGAQATGDLNGPYPGPITVATWGGQTKAAVVGSYQPQAHALTHRPGGSDAVSGLTDASMAPANVDGAGATASLRTLGPGAQQAMPGNDSRVTGGGIGQTGDLFVSAAAARPGCLLCDGSAVNRLTYPALFATIGTAYGAGDGSSTFNVPNFAGRTLVGAGAGFALGAYGGEATHTLVNGEMPVHSHGAATGADSPDHSHYTSGETGGQSADHTHTVYENVGGSGTVILYGSGLSGHGSFGATGTSTTGYGTTGSSNDHAHAWGAQSGGASARHAHGIGNDGGGGAHNNMQPYAVVNVFIKT